MESFLATCFHSFDFLVKVKTKNPHLITTNSPYLSCILHSYTYLWKERQLLNAYLGMYLHQLLENLLTYVQCIFWSAEWDRWGVPKHVPLPTEFHKTYRHLHLNQGIIPLLPALVNHCQRHDFHSH